ncbi:MAG TPA: TOBE domain-containing protein, partial [Spirochaetota bacterium]|nr:TOBE domain-containing protein [Spirochaetota bacterium]
IVVMRAGYIQQVDDPITLYHHPNNKFVAGFIGTPPMNFFDVELKKDGNYIYAVDGEMKIRLSNDIVEQLTAKNFNKTQAVLGIRPEDIYLKESYNNPFEDNFCKGNIDVVEPLGAQSFLYINNGNTTFIASGPNNLDQSNVGKNIEVAFDLKRVKLFDKDNEETVVDLHY